MLVLADTLAAWFYQWRDGGHHRTIIFWLEATVQTNNELLFFNHMVYLVDLGNENLLQMDSPKNPLQPRQGFKP